MNLVDSSGWLEYLVEGPNASFFASALENTDDLIVSVINMYEVFKKITRERSEDSAWQVVGLMNQAYVVQIDTVLALEAARLSIDVHLPMADSLILTTARRHQAVLWTQDAHFSGLDGVRFIAKQSK
ncbi:VapC toxin family PIN domain ribonuclease [Candidatus Wirthbacteria bacterium CG2_30_54_11]|uniref:VapC toxin family PIN domain ribonuclease n=1 Tax=Candidatus Wirthbacteria bacterium CG2_30_54_11 TaxID=1817892 RepID=A0A1J5IR98_9BACT|nr:MAG: VapC toxin family PIN domain ribonuclease [Candidatus Wirthbacteria bacterium CG2_30_54_11]